MHLTQNIFATIRSGVTVHVTWLVVVFVHYALIDKNSEASSEQACHILIFIILHFETVTEIMAAFTLEKDKKGNLNE